MNPLAVTSPPRRVAHLELHVDDPADLDDRRLAALEDQVAPGGTLHLTTRRLGGRAARRLARRLARWFEGETPAPGARYPAVVARSDGAHTRYALRRSGGGPPGHFDDMALGYADELPAHIVAHYRERKLDRVQRALPMRRPLRILDLGCGVGLYAPRAAARFDAAVVAVDGSPASVRAAQGRNGAPQVRFAASHALALPFRDATFDAVYTINVLHHLKRGDQARMLRETARLLAPGGVLVVLEVNTRNPIFSWYMRHVFPRRHRIDRGDEEFVRPDDLPLPPTLRLDDVATFTFLPDFLPRPLLRALGPAERAVERTPLGRFGIHYAAALRRTEDRT